MQMYKGTITIETGPMFSGKSSALKEKYRRFKIAGYNSLAFKPDIDTRNASNIIFTHTGESIEAKTITSIDDILTYCVLEKPDFIFIDEIQFLTDKSDYIAYVITKIIREYGCGFVIAGLNLDYLGNSFAVVEKLTSIAEYVTRHHSICMECKGDAWISYKTTSNTKRIDIGAEEKYIPLCRSCWNKKMNLE